MAEKFASVGAIIKNNAQLILEGLQGGLAEANSIASRSLFQSIQINVAITGNLYTMEISMEKYWRWVNDGRKAGKFPPIDFISKWTVQKGFSMEEVYSRLRKGKSLVTRKRGGINRVSVRKQLVFVIARKIARKGTKPIYFASKVLGEPFINRGELSAPIWKKMKSELTAAFGKEVIVQVVNFKN